MKDKIFGVLQRIGRSFMLPIAILPVAGLLLGVGSSFTNATMIETYHLQAILGEGTILNSLLTIMSKAGSIIFDNLPIIFAVGVAIGMAKKEKEVAALAAMISFFVMNATMNAMLLIRGDLLADGTLGAGVLEGTVTSVCGIQTLQMGVFGGIIVGLGVAALHNRYHKIVLPSALSFFGGSRFVPIISTITYMFVGIAMYFVWPIVQNGIYALGSLVTGTGYFGTLIFGIVKRALIPFGLHHVFYLPFWQTAVGGTMEVGGKLIQGGQNIFFAQLADSAHITHFSADATRYFSGEFIFMIFGLPGAALAMYQAALPEKKKEVSGLLLSAALTSMLCMGAPLSSTLVAGIASLRLQKTAAAAGAVVPGWAAIEELGGVDTVQVDADELFTADSVNLEDIRIFKGGRIDRAILYAASILNHSCETLRGLFRQIIEDRTEILYPVKDLEVHHGLGFAAWCDNNRVLIGNRLYMEREGVPLPEQEYEDEHSQNGALQILYLAVSGSLHAMFVLHYVGGRNAARGLEVLQRENIRLLVTCEDPSLTARHITEAYHLPEGMITLLDQEQCSALTPAQPDETARCCMLHDKGFASLIGGLRAAEKAQNAETSATTVQMVSVWFSVVIGVLLTYAGSIGTLSVAAVLMYQAAWSALSIAVCALKQHN